MSFHPGTEDQQHEFRPYGLCTWFILVYKFPTFDNQWKRGFRENQFPMLFSPLTNTDTNKQFYFIRPSLQPTEWKTFSFFRIGRSVAMWWNQLKSLTYIKVSFALSITQSRCCRGGCPTGHSAGQAKTAHAVARTGHCFATLPRHHYSERWHSPLWYPEQRLK